MRAVRVVYQLCEEGGESSGLFDVWSNGGIRPSVSCVVLR